MNAESGTAGTAVIVIGAGLSRRFGGSKMLAELGGKALILHAVEQSLRSAASRVIVVVNEGIAGKRIFPGGVEVIINQNPSRGVGSSISAGASNLQGVKSCIVLAGDQPFVSTGILNELIRRHELSVKAVIACRYAGAVRNPVLFPESLFAALTSMDGDRGARQLVLSAGVPVDFVDVREEWKLMDIDSRDDLVKAEAILAQHSGK